MVVFRLFEKLRYSNERSTKFESLYQEWKYLEEENGKMVALRISPKIEADTKVGPDQLGPPVRAGSKRIHSDRLGSSRIMEKKHKIK